MSIDWDLARVFLAVARSGQLLGAARKLGVDHATVSRRVNTLEAQMGVKLIERRTNGCTLTPAGEAFLASAERIETEMLRAQASLSGFDVALEGEVRVGAPDGFGTYILARHLGALMDRHPGLTIQLVPLPRALLARQARGRHGGHHRAAAGGTPQRAQAHRLSAELLCVAGLCGRP